MDNQTHNAAGILGGVIEKFVSPDDNTTLHSDDGETKIDVRFVDETVWLTQQQLCDLYQTSKSTISEHIKNIFEEEELEENAVVRKFRTTASDEKNILLPSLHYETGHSNSFTIAKKAAMKLPAGKSDSLIDFFLVLFDFLNI